MTADVDDLGRAHGVERRAPDGAEGTAARDRVAVADSQCLRARTRRCETDTECRDSTDGTGRSGELEEGTASQLHTGILASRRVGSDRCKQRTLGLMGPGPEPGPGLRQKL